MKAMIDFEKGILYKGNTYRLKEIMKKAMNGECLTIGFIGGSITQGSVATEITKCYAYHVYEWWVNTFSKASFTFLNAGIGATDSHFACARVCEDLLINNPDFVITEFSVNDLNNDHFLETYEGLVRKIYSYKSKPALITMNNVFYDSGENAEDKHVKVSKHMEIPALGIRPSIYQAIKDGKLEAKSITPDNLHPNDDGHKLVGEQITFFLQKIYDEIDVEEKEALLPAPITKNSYENSFRYNNLNFSPRLNGFTADTEKQTGLSDCFKNGWIGKMAGDKISFTVKGCNFGVMFRKSYRHPAPIAKLTLDGKKEIILDANFDETWGDKLFLEMVAEGLENCDHVIEVEVVESHTDDTAPFYLASVLASV